MILNELTSCLEEFADLSLQESYDNSGLLVGSPDMDIKKALVCLDVTIDVIKEAIKNQCNLIISHHPIIFHKIKNIRFDNPTGQIVFEAIKNNIAIYAAHTNMDTVNKGLNAILCEKLNILDYTVLRPMQNVLKKLVTFSPESHVENIKNALFASGAGFIGNYDCCSYSVNGVGSFRALDGANPYVGKKNEVHFENEVRIEFVFPSFVEKKLIKALLAAHPYEEVAYDIYSLSNSYNHSGSGMIGKLEKPMKQTQLLDHIKKVLKVPFLKYSFTSNNKIQTVAVCGGSGSFLIGDAIKHNADAIVTADVKYHDFFDASQKLLVVDAGHFETEQFIKELFVEILIKKFPNFAVLISKVHTNPVNYY